MDKRITFKAMREAMDKLQKDWGVDDDVIVIYDDYIADTIQSILDDTTTPD